VNTVNNETSNIKVNKYDGETHVITRDKKQSRMLQNMQQT